MPQFTKVTFKQMCKNSSEDIVNVMSTLKLMYFSQVSDFSISYIVQVIRHHAITLTDRLGQLGQHMTAHMTSY